MNIRNVFFVGIFFFLISAPLVRADGMAFIAGRDSLANALHGEHTQIAAINYEDGKEKLVIAVKIDQIKDDEVVWIVPVPAKPEDVKINILKDFPRFAGSDVNLIAQEDVNHFSQITRMLVFLNQVWTLPLFYTEGVSTFSQITLGGVEVYAEVEKEGILTQVVTAETSEGLYTYMRNKGVSVSETSIPVLDNYIGKNYSFVVSWLTGTGKSGNYNVPAIFVEFPADKIFYPLKPTSIYGARGVPVVIYIVGFVKPEFYDDIEEYARYKYFYGGSAPPSSWPSDFYDPENFNKGFYYTRINIGYETQNRSELTKKISELRNQLFTRELNKSEEEKINREIHGLSMLMYTVPEASMLNLETPPAGKFTEDLWLEKLEKAPPEVELKLAKAEIFKTLSYVPIAIPLQYGSIPIPVGSILLIVITSVLSAIIAGLITFKEKWILEFAILGLANVFTLFGLILATLKLTKKEDVKEGRSRKQFIVGFSLVFLVLNVLILHLLTIW